MAGHWAKCTEPYGANFLSIKVRRRRDYILDIRFLKLYAHLPHRIFPGSTTVWYPVLKKYCYIDMNYGQEVPKPWEPHSDLTQVDLHRLIPHFHQHKPGQKSGPMYIWKWAQQNRKQVCIWHKWLKTEAFNHLLQINMTFLKAEE